MRYVSPWASGAGEIRPYYSILIGCLFALQGSAPCGNFPQVIKGNFLAPFDGGFEPIGENRTRRRSAADVRLGSKADMCSAKRHVRFTPESGLLQSTGRCPLRANSGHSAVHSITSSASCRNELRTESPSALAVFRLKTSSNLLGACTGKLPGDSPLRMRST